VTHVVEVQDGQFLWQGESWPSLTAIAQEITGAHWSGSRFFGLTTAKRPGKKTAPKRCEPAACQDCAEEADPTTSRHWVLGMTARPVIRAAIYTRKSTQDGLDQEFNSLDAQNEACAVYIASQRHEGWSLVRERFDDGGVFGGTLDCPGLQRLLAEVDAGRIGMIVVYKIDRLTGSLSDFARLVDRLDAAKASFVSVTQVFNTSTSMGRLTLNVLLSFAQFEREVTAERIRDKIAASKRKGLWMGGTVPLGNKLSSDQGARRIIPDEKDAGIVRQVFDLYDQLGNIRLVEEQVGELGLRTRAQLLPSGSTRGGRLFTRGQIHYLLTNPTYRGLVRHKDKTFPGSHPAIISQDQWARVQQALRAPYWRRLPSKACLMAAMSSRSCLARSGVSSGSRSTALKA
jgi:site-specific DNA recombinase